MVIAFFEENMFTKSVKVINIPCILLIIIIL